MTTRQAAAVIREAIREAAKEVGCKPSEAHDPPTANRAGIQARNAAIVADESHYFDEGGFEIECNDCEREFKVWPNISVSWRTESVANDQIQQPRERQ